MASTEPLLRMEQIDKRFPGVHALDHVDFDLYAGEVHVLLGENGAGKSTLMKILSGVVPRDSGRIYIDGQEVGALDPERAQELGVGLVHQEFSLVPSLTVAENIFLGDPPRNRFGMVDWREMMARAKEALRQLGVDIDPHTVTRRLDVSEQQLTEIARVLRREPRILLLDEPTSALSDAERERLFKIIDRLRTRDIGIVYITHQLKEVPRVGQRVTVLRDGKVVDTRDVDAVDEDILVQMMVGREITEQYAKPDVERGRELLRVERLSTDDGVNDVSFTLSSGEIVGIFGLMGAGQSELARALFGLQPKTAGRMFVAGQEAQIDTPSDAIRHGIGFLTRDRQEALVPMMPVTFNVTLAELSDRAVFSRLNLGSERDAVGTLVDNLRIQTPSLDREVVFLSGGNQQKVVVARWLHSEAEILIFEDATRGIDVGAKAEVFALMNDLVHRGAGIIMISSDMRELLGMADRILVMRNGQFSAELDPDVATQEIILRNAT